jgi:RHS repeat-associated protein
VAQERKSTGEVLRYYEGPGIDQHLAVDGLPGGVNYYVSDHLGSIVRVTNASGDIVLSRDYDPFGRLTAGSSQAGYGFTGRDWDVEAGLYYYRARNYDPDLGRFISEDPIGFESGEANHYSYVSNNPTKFTDPAGTMGREGGPWHPPAGVHTKCLPTDDCGTLQNKMWLLEKMIKSHEGWDRNVPRPRGGNRHATEIAELWVQYASCQAQWVARCAPPPTCNDECKQNVTNATAAAAVLATGYIVYRCVRMVPSFAPPLWWTIPANAAIP